MKPLTVPACFHIPDLPQPLDRFKYVYKLIKNLYGLKDAGRTWNQHLHKGLLSRGWKQFKTNECLYVKGNVLLIIYVDNACFISPDKLKIKLEIELFKRDFHLTDEGDLSDYLGTRFDCKKDGTVELTMVRMIKRVLDIISLGGRDYHLKTHNTPAVNVLQTSKHKQSRNQTWHN